MDTTLQDPLIGRVLDRRYRVSSLLARGGMATVYLALDTRLDRTVALKVMHSDLAEDPDFVSRFIREAKSAARLSHPNIVAVYDQGEDGGHVFLAMEYVEGRTLRDVLARWRRLGPEEAFTVLEPVLAALSAAHAAGLVHRDVKPENVLLADDGRVKVADFGLVHAVSTAASAATEGALMGTVNYLSPEQVQRGIADPRSDVYAAGIMLYEMLTGQKPHDADNPMQVVYRHVHEDVPPPSALVPGIPPAVDGLVAAATARDPDRRPVNAAHFLADLRNVRRGLAPADGGVDGQTTAQFSTAQFGTGQFGTGQFGTGQFGTGDLPEAARDQAYNRTIAVPVPPPPPQAARRPASSLTTPRRGSGWIAFGVILAFVAAVIGAAWWLGSGRYVHAPPVLRLDRADAARAIESAGLKAEFKHTYHETVPKGLVAQTKPKPGARIVRGATMIVYLSDGPERIPVPSLAGKRLAEAKDTLDRRRLALGKVEERFSSSVDKDLVIKTTPKAGTRVAPGTEVTVTVSKGEPPVDVPNVVGRDVDAALGRLERAGLSGVVAEEVFSDEVDAGKVVRQDPGGDERADSGTTVRLSVSKGPEQIDVPDVVGQRLEDARRELERAGFKVRTVDLLPGGPDRVRGQIPGGGSRRVRGTVITLTVV